MAKIKINKLPKGFKLVEGKVVEDKFMKEGGDLTTGDQADYGLVTTPQDYYGVTSFNNTSDENVRYSLSGVPRENANIEAEGGETVLTDLNEDGNFGLYNITGPRHSKGGVPMFLPDQSFIYSDTPKLKFGREELEEFDIYSTRKMTPAKLSQRFGLNDFYAELDSEYADNISSRSAELMLKKNMEDLSKLAFMQESKKSFEDGVPLASHPYLMSIGVDPLQFTAEMEQISMQEAQQKALEGLTPEQRDQLQYLQMMIAQAQQNEATTSQPENEEMPMQQNEGPVDEMDLAGANNAMMQTAKFGSELTDFMRRAQEGPGTDGGSKKTERYEILGRDVDRATYIDLMIRNNLHRGVDGKLNALYNNFDWTEEEKKMYGKAIQPEVPEGWDPFNREVLEGDLSGSVAPTNDGTFDQVDANFNAPSGSSSNNPSFKNPYPQGSEEYKKLEKYNSEGYTITEKDGKIRIYKPGTSKFEVQGETVIGDYETVGRGEVDTYNEDISGQGDVLAESGIGRYRKGLYAGKRPEQQGAIYENQIVDGVFDASIAPDRSSGIYSYGTPSIKSKDAQADFETRWGDVTSTIEGFDFNKPANDPQWLEFQNKAEAKRKEEAEAQGIPYVPYFTKKGSEGYVKGSDWDGKFGLHTFNTPRLDVDFTPEEEMFMDLPEKELEVPKDPPIEEKPGVPKRWWAQDENNLMTLGMLNDTLRLPFFAPLERQNIDYVLDDYTGAVGANNAALNTMADALTAAGGPQALIRSDLFGKTLDANAKAINRVNQNNVKTMNRVASLQPQLDLTVDRLNNAGMQGVYDNTQLALENYEKNANEMKIKANELFNAGATNAANTFNLNNLYDNFNTNPSLYGNVEFTEDGRQLYKDSKSDDLNAFYDKVLDYENKTGNPMPEGTQKSLYEAYGLGRKTPIAGTTVGQEELNRRGVPSYPGNMVVEEEEVKRGKELKKGKLPRWAAHFYTGKMGM